MQAALLTYSCGATVGYHTVVVVQPAGRPATAERSDAAIMVKGIETFYFHWKDDRTLVVRRPRERILELRDEVRGVKMEYEL
jgi:hypothetical protein